MEMIIIIHIIIILKRYSDVYDHCMMMMMMRMRMMRMMMITNNYN